MQIIQFMDAMDKDKYPEPGLAGSIKGTFVLPLPEDFDAPLEEFEEYI